MMTLGHIGLNFDSNQTLETFCKTGYSPAFHAVRRTKKSLTEE